MIAYTHKPVDGAQPAAEANRRFIAEAIAGGFLVNLSGDNPSHAAPGAYSARLAFTRQEHLR